MKTGHTPWKSFAAMALLAIAVRSLFASVPIASRWATDCLLERRTAVVRPSSATDALVVGCVLSATASALPSLNGSAAAATTGKGTQTETVQRWMSKAELEATKDTGLFRGGRGGTHYATDAANSSPLRARQRLSLDHTPEVRVELEVPAGRFSQPTRVAPLIENGRVTMPGGGMERTAIGDVPTRVMRVYQ